MGPAVYNKMQPQPTNKLLNKTVVSYTKLNLFREGTSFRAFLTDLKGSRISTDLGPFLSEKVAREKL